MSCSNLFVKFTQIGLCLFNEYIIWHLIFNKLCQILSSHHLCETGLDSCVTVNQIESDMYVELLLVFTKDKSVCFYIFVKTDLLSVLAMWDYVRGFLPSWTESELTIVSFFMCCVLMTLAFSWLSVEKTSHEEEKQ